MRRVLAVSTAWALVLTLGCGPGEETGMSSTAGPVEILAPTFDQAALDAVTWGSDEERLERGQAVFEEHCVECHGPTGDGEGGYIFGGQSVTPPSWLRADWPLANDPTGLRRYIVTGSLGGMPYWGLAGVSYRDVDAVAAYIVEVLRPTYGERPLSN